ncbi:MAG: hypothetical protein E7677_02650 [Ruminococcaceae bacterium]|nr:hypothetical protein [Oscillospiraceae bacterium]
MLKLLKVDFKRVFKDKLFLVVCILAGVFAVVTPLLYVAIFGSIGVETNEMSETLEALGMAINAKSMFFQSFSLGNNLGLILPVLLAIILCKDFAHGTVRNKIISGKSRTSIFLSMYSVCFCVLFGAMVLHALLTMLISLIFFPYQSTEFVASDIGYFLLSLLFEALIYVFVAALVSFLCACTKNMGLAIVGYVAVVMIMSVLTSILQFGALMVPVADGGDSVALKVIEFLQDINLFNFSTVIGVGTKYSAREVLCCILSPTILSAGITLLGIFKFKKKDIK